ncbi:MAG: hypothetical protein P1P63_02975 [Treponemataceae bacterium]
MKTIGTLNESSLHETLKEMFTPPGAENEVAVGNYVCDILCADNKIIEIQTANVSSLHKKLSVLLKAYSVKVVFPIFENNFIRTFSVLDIQAADASTSEPTLIQKSFKKSPKHETFFSVFRELTGVYPLLGHKNFSLHLVFADIETVKIDDKKGRSRYGNARIVDKKLLKINREMTLVGLDDLVDPVLTQLPDQFSSKDVQKLTNKKDAAFTLWVLRKCGVAVPCGKIGNRYRYTKGNAD